MPDMPAASGLTQKDYILKSAHRQIMQWSRVHINQCLEQLAERLFQIARDADNNDDQTRFMQSHQELQRRRNHIQQTMLSRIDRAFQLFLQAKKTHLCEGEEEGTKKLSLIDNDTLEENLAIATMCRRCSGDCTESLYAICQRLSALQGGTRVDEQHNPVAPAVFAQALQTSIGELQLDKRSRLTIFKVFDAGFMSKLDKMYKLLNHQMEKMGLLPNLGFVINKRADQLNDQPAAGLASHALTANPQPDAQSISNQLRLIQLIQQAQQSVGVGGAAGHNTPLPASVAPSTTAAYLQQLQQRQQQFAAALSSLESRQAIVENAPLQPVQTTPPAGNSGDHASATIELVGMLFEVMLNLDSLPDSVKALLSYLHTPFLKIALLERELFQQPQHPARQLLNALVAAGEHWVEAQGNRKGDIFLQIRTTVQRVLKEFQQDSELFSALLEDFNRALETHRRRVDVTEKRARQAAQGESKLREIRFKVEVFLHRRADHLQLPEPITALLFGPWASYLAFNLLRYGSKSKQWRAAADVVEQLLRYHTLSANESASLYTGLALALQLGFETVGYDRSKGQELLDQLKQLRQRAPAAAGDNATARSDSSADIDQLDIGPHLSRQVRDEALLERIKQLPFGSQLLFNANQPPAQQQRVKLAWANNRTLHYMFVNSLGQQIAIKDAAELAEDLQQGRCRILSDGKHKPFIEKALERVLEQIQHRNQPNNAKA